MNENDRSPAPAPAAPQPDCGISELEAMLARVRAAQKEYATFPQEKVDAIFRAAALAANRARRFSVVGKELTKLQRYDLLD